MRTMVRTLIAVLLIAVPLLEVPLLAAIAGPADAQVSKPVHASKPADLGKPADPGEPRPVTHRSASRSVSIAVTKMSPDWAKPGTTVTVQGTVSNNTGSPISGVQIEVRASLYPFQDRTGMESYAAGSSSSSSSGYLFLPMGSGYKLPRVLHTGVTMRWSVSFRVQNGLFGGFGVYPLAAVAEDSGLSTLAVDRTMLPYWPGGKPASPANLAWIWPLVDDPQEGPCPQTLADDSLATSLTAGGRLGGLLSSGVRGAQQSELTWAVDPALLADARTMTAPYKTGGNAACTGTTPRPASAAASDWLASLRANTATEPMFVTPYADPDASALVHAGLDPDLQAAFGLGDEVAGQSLHRAFGKNNTGTGDGGAPSVAWPAGGTADAGVLNSLANAGGISTVVLGSDALPAGTPAVTTTQTGVGTTAHVVLADSGLTNVLGSAQTSAGGQFAMQQEFLAETAMIVASSPSGSKSRSVVVAPPRRWTPSAATASALLSMSTSVPWLRPKSLSSVASSDAPSRLLPGHEVSGSELNGSYLKYTKSVVGPSLWKYQSLLSGPDDGTERLLRGAMAATESSAWRGQGLSAGWVRSIDYGTFLGNALQGVKIIASKKTLMLGASADLALSIRNTLDNPVQVGVRAQPSGPSAAQMTVGKISNLVTVPAGKTAIVKIPVHATGIETTTLQLQLVTRNGSPLGDPGKPMTMTVQVTRYGSALLILIGAALGVVVLTSAARWVRQWAKDTRAGSGGTG